MRNQPVSAAFASSRGARTIAYRIDPHASLQSELRVISTDQIDNALASLSKTDDDLEEAVHDARKRLKKLRALLRLVRPALGKTYDRENKAFRDIGRRFSAVRDAQVLCETLDGLSETARGAGGGESLAIVRDWAEARRNRVLRDRDLDELVARTRTDLATARLRIDAWKLDDDPREALAGGLARTYRRARKRYGNVAPGSPPELFHEWRKRVKYHWYHCRLLRRAWPDGMKPRIEALDELGDVLGAEHDLSVLRQVLRAEAAGGVPGPDLAVVDDLAAASGRDLRAEALEKAPPLFVETPKALTRRIVGTWGVAQKAG